MTQSIKVPGGIMRNGVLIRDGFSARIGAPKKLTVPHPAHGMRDVSASGHPLAFVGGKRPLDDETADKLCVNAKTVPVHNGMRTETPEHRGADYGVDHGSNILRSAGYGSYASDVAAQHGVARLKK